MGGQGQGQDEQDNIQIMQSTLPRFGYGGAGQLMATFEIRGRKTFQSKGDPLQKYYSQQAVNDMGAAGQEWFTSLSK